MNDQYSDQPFHSSASRLLDIARAIGVTLRGGAAKPISFTSILMAFEFADDPSSQLFRALAPKGTSEAIRKHAAGFGFGEERLLPRPETDTSSPDLWTENALKVLERARAAAATRGQPVAAKDILLARLERRPARRREDPMVFELQALRTFLEGSPTIEEEGSTNPLVPAGWDRALSGVIERATQLATANQLAVGVVVLLVALHEADLDETKELIAAIQRAAKGPVGAGLLVRAMPSRGEPPETSNALRELLTTTQLECRARGVVIIGIREVLIRLFRVDDVIVLGAKRILSELLASVGLSNEELSQIVSARPRVPTGDWVARISNDDAAQTDRLGVESDARAFARLIVSPELSPPLSIGLFGEWGSGKTTFMRLIEKTMGSLGAAERGVISIRFNAWHYVGGDVFAGLANALFTGLERSAAAKPANDDETLETRRRKLENLLKGLDRSQSTVKVAVSELKTQRKRLKSYVRQAFNTATKQLPENMQSLIEEAPKDLASFEEAIANLRATVAELRWRHVWTLAKWLGPALLVGAGVWMFQSDIAQAIRKVIAFATLFMALCGVGGYVKSARELYGRVIPVLRRLEADRIKVREAQETRVRAARDKVAEALAARAGSIKAIDETRSERRLQRLVESRLRDATYAKHLGIVETLRGDFETISVLLNDDEAMANQRRALLAERGLTEEKLPKIRRIVLFIDDLDRCDPHVVSNVLQAVHLFLAFPLFVAVVAVDARWATASLERVHPHLVANGPADTDTATAADYLEKIFQIPYWVRPMERTGVIGILKDAWERPNIPPDPLPQHAAPSVRVNIERPNLPEAIQPAQPTPNLGDVPSAALKMGRVPSPSSPKSGEGVAPTDQVARSGVSIEVLVYVTEEEQRYAETFAEQLRGSPRRLKRFANLFRLFKAAYGELRDEQAQIVLRLLALLTAPPNLAPEILAQLEEQGHGSLLLPARATDAHLCAHSAEWIYAEALLEPWSEETKPTSSIKAHLKKHAPEVARYAFRLSNKHRRADIHGRDGNQLPLRTPGHA